MSTIPGVVIPDQFNAATAFLDRNLAEGRGTKTDSGTGKPCW